MGWSLAELKAQGVGENTIVFFTSDNGHVGQQSQPDHAPLIWMNATGHALRRTSFEVDLSLFLSAP